MFETKQLNVTARFMCISGSSGRSDDPIVCMIKIEPLKAQSPATFITEGFSPAACPNHDHGEDEIQQLLYLLDGDATFFRGNVQTPPSWRQDRKIGQDQVATSAASATSATSTSAPARILSHDVGGVKAARAAGEQGLAMPRLVWQSTLDRCDGISLKWTEQGT